MAAPAAASRSCDTPPSRKHRWPHWRTTPTSSPRSPKSPSTGRTRPATRSARGARSASTSETSEIPTSADRAPGSNPASRLRARRVRQRRVRFAHRTSSTVLMGERVPRGRMKTTKTSFVRMAACLIAAALTSVACGIESQDAPSLIGPSGFGQSVTMNAVPDRLPRDGSSQSVITISVRNDSGQPVSGQRVTLGASHGSLSQSDVVTGNNGTATFTLTSPPPGSTGNMIEVYATAVTGIFDNAITRSLSIAITGPGNSTAPTPQFVMTPENPGERETVTFDATTTTDEGGPCGNACTYSWNFGDGTTRTGAIVTHTFNAAGVYMVTLTVTDSGGASASRQRLVTVSRVASPTIASIAASPNPPLAGQLATFSATVTPAPNRTITNYEWNFGDGTSQTTSGPTVTKRYATQGVYVVTL